MVNDDGQHELQDLPDIAEYEDVVEAFRRTTSVVATNKYGRFRYCIDYRGLNK